MNTKGDFLKLEPEHRLNKIITLTDYKLVFAESCTGGLLSHLITNVPGSSDYFLGGVVTYSNDAKHRILGVQEETLTEFGAVSKETVIEMALNVRKMFSDIVPFEKLIGASISGVAGPGGGTREKPVGLVWIGISHNDITEAHKFIWDGTREENKFDSAYKCIELIIGTINK